MNKFDPEKSAGFLISRVAYQIRVHIRRFLEEAGIQLSPEEVAILTAIYHFDPPTSMGEMAERLARDPTTLHHQLKHLVETGMVRRMASVEDRRIINVSITDEGRALVDSIMPMTLALRKRTLEGISEPDRQIMVKALSRMLKNLI